MIDDFLQELFTPDAPGPGAGVNFAGRFGGMAPPDDGGMLPPGAMPTAGAAPPNLMPPAGGVPLPRARPDIEGILAGGGGGGAPGAPMAPPPGAPGPMDIMARLLGSLGGRGPAGAPGSAPPPPAAQDDEGGTMGKLLGPSGQKRFFSSLAGGMAGGNPAFGGGAFMKGMSGGLSGGLKSDKEDTEAATAASDKEQKQGNFDRTQMDKEKTSEVLRKLYGQRGDALATNAATRAANPPGSGKGKAWDKPPHQRLHDAEQLIINKEKTLNGSLPLGLKDRAVAEAANKKELDAFKKRIYTGYGIDQDGNELPNASPSAPSAASGGLRGSGSYADPHVPETQEQFDKVPPGGYFINPSDGEILRKKGGAKTSALDDGASDQDAA